MQFFRQENSRTGEGLEVGAVVYFDVDAEVVEVVGKHFFELSVGLEWVGEVAFEATEQYGELSGCIGILD